VAARCVTRSVGFARTIKRGIGISVGLDLSMFDRGGRRLMVLLRANCLRAARSDLRVLNRELDLLFKAADLRSARAGVGCGDEHKGEPTQRCKCRCIP